MVTTIGTDHISAFGTIEAIAAEKGKLVAALPPHGTAVLNADDPRVLAMRAQCVGRILTYGVAPEAMVRAEDISASWPARLSFTVRYRGQAHEVRTQLCGAHWTPCVPAALAVALTMGVPLETAVRAVQRVPPFPRRMEPILQDGVTWIRDDLKAPLWGIPLALQFLQDSRAKRKILVFGTISDFRGSSNNRIYADMARQALAVADHVVFGGPRAAKALRARRQPGDVALQAFYTVEAAYDYARALLQPGDLVFLKDSNCGERLDVLMAARQTDAAPPPSTAVPLVTRGSDARPVLAVVGLGNPEAQAENTPHNVGQRALDHLAHTLGAVWTQEAQALVARVERGGTTVHLIKPLTHVNANGPVLAPLMQRLGVGPSTCVLVYDDADLPLGTVRACTAATVATGEFAPSWKSSTRKPCAG